MFFDCRSFVDELEKIAAEKAIYSPGVVAHEAGHAWLHRHPTKPGEEKTDVMGLARTFGPLVTAGGYLAYEGIKKKTPSGLGLSTALAVGMAPMLVDEYGSSIRGHGELKKGKVKQFTDKELATERNKLIGAGATYATLPVATMAPHLAKSRGGMLALQLGLVGGQLGGLAVATGPKGAKITAGQAKKLVQDIAPGTEVYVSKDAVPMGSAYVPPSKSRIGKVLTNWQLRPYLKDEDRKRISEKGGVLIAPMNRKVITKALLGENYTHDTFKRVK